jgi:hypothetical protein
MGDVEKLMSSFPRSLLKRFSGSESGLNLHSREVTSIPETLVLEPVAEFSVRTVAAGPSEVSM